MSNKRRTVHSTKKSSYLKAFSYKDVVHLPFFIAVCKRCKANLATLSKREPDFVDNDGGDDDDEDESDEYQDVIIAAKHLVLGKEVRKCLSRAQKG